MNKDDYITLSGYCSLFIAFVLSIVNCFVDSNVVYSLVIGFTTVLIICLFCQLVDCLTLVLRCYYG